MSSGLVPLYVSTKNTIKEMRWYIKNTPHHDSVKLFEKKVSREKRISI